MNKTELINKNSYDFSDLCEIVDILRAPDGCPWDKEQTHASIRKGLIEETYEVVEGIDKNDDKIMCEELGDLLLQIVFHASISKDENAFDINDICTGICRKLIYRHPHIFSDVKAETSDEVLRNWDNLKKQEKGQKSRADVLNSVSSALPSLMRAQKLSSKAGETYSTAQICDDISKLALEIKAGDTYKIGELLFDAARLGNSEKMDLEQILYNKNEAFCRDYSKK